VAMLRRSKASSSSLIDQREGTYIVLEYELHGIPNTNGDQNGHAVRRSRQQVLVDQTDFTENWR